MNTIRLTPRWLGIAASLLVLWNVTAAAADDAPPKEDDLLAVLRSDAEPAEKAITCKKLAIYGSKAAVGDLAKLLPDPHLSSWARIALEAIPGPEADEALRTAALSLEGELLVGTLNSIGVRRDAAAVKILSQQLQNKDAQAASAAAVALGKIGNDEATKTLRSSLASTNGVVRSAVAEGCVLCAERRFNAGDTKTAAEIYDQVRQADVPKQRIIEATRGAILARKDEGIPMLAELLNSDDKQMFQLALQTARELPAGGIDQALAKALKSAKPDRAALIVITMADRPESVDLAAILQAAKEGPQPVRLAAIDALGKVGDASCLQTLMEASQAAEAELANAAKESLAGLGSEKVDAQILAQLKSADAKSYPLLLALIGQRRIDAVDDVLKAVDNSDAKIRQAALTALGEIVSLKRLSVLVAQATSPKHAEDAAVAQQALKAAAVRMPDRDACAAELATAIEQSPAATKSLLLEILAEVGGTKALQTLATASKSNNAELQDTGSRLLGKWNSVEAAPVLLDLASNAPEAKYQIRSLRGYIGLARKFAMPEAERVAMCQKAFDLAKQPAEKKLVLDVLAIHPSPEGLQFAIAATKVPEVKNEATQATLVIAQKVGAKGVDVSDLIAAAGLEKVKVEIIKAEYGSGSTFKDVTAVLKKQASDLPVLALPAASYNASFGGDPTPGAVKQLKVQYRLDGKEGAATFAEDALILLPMPK